MAGNKGSVRAKRGRRLLQLLSGTGRVAASAASTIASAEAGPAAGVPTALAVETVFNQIGSEVQKRMLGPREAERIGEVFAYALSEIETKLDAGEQARDDGFFDEDVSHRTHGHELLEGVLLAAGRTYEEQKLPYLGNFYASLVFRSDISSDFAHGLLHIAKQLTWVELRVLALVTETRSIHLAEHIKVFMKVTTPSSSPTKAPIALPFEGLLDKRLLGIRQGDGTVVPKHGPLDAITFDQLALTPKGATLVELMGLRNIDGADINTVGSDVLRFRELDFADPRSP